MYTLLILGKTCLTYRFCSGKFPEKSEATIGRITIHTRFVIEQSTHDFYF
jgi:GTPase SAR1 family protein